MARLSLSMFLLLLSSEAVFSHRENLESDWDLEKYVSRPDLRPPKFKVDVLDEDNVTPGYWFVCPYEGLIDRLPPRLYQPHQVGPHIYNNQGQLVWSGANLFPNRNTFDFKATSAQPQANFTFLLGANEYEKKETAGAGIIVDNKFQVRHQMHATKGVGTVDMHEFSVMRDGRSALAIIHEDRIFQSSEPTFSGWITDMGFVEMDVDSGKTLFEWWASDHIHPLESTLKAPMGRGAASKPWDFLHLNSVDKDDDGDYLVSGRHTSTIYKISASDGSIIWRLGGKNSSFVQDGFNFSSQHDARFLSKNGSATSITFLNNASDGSTQTSECSSALTVYLDTSVEPFVAKLIQKLDRPDKKWTTHKGNAQKLPNAHTFVGWSEKSYITEFNADGHLVLSAEFISDRFSTYRAYKFDFVGTPIDPPDVVCSAYGTSMETATTVCYASWNGATEVESWKFWTSETSHYHEVQYLGAAQKKGFETLFMATGLFRHVFVEALDRDGTSLRNSTIVETVLPEALDVPQKTSTTNASSEKYRGGDNRLSQTYLGELLRRGKAFGDSSYFPVAMFFAVLAVSGVAASSLLAKCLTGTRTSA